MNAIASNERLLTARECAERLGYKGESAWKRVIGLANRGMLPVLRLGRTMRFHWPSVLEAQFRPPVCTQPTSGGGEPRSILRHHPGRQTVKADAPAAPTEGLSPLDLDAPGVGGNGEPRKSSPPKHQSRLESGRLDRAAPNGRLPASRTLHRGNADLFPKSQQRTAARKRPDSGASDRTQRAAVVKARRSPIPPRKSSNPYL